MYSNVYQWRRIRKRVLVWGESRRGVAKSEGISVHTLRKMLAYELPPGYRRCSRQARSKKPIQKLMKAAHPRALAVKRRWMEWLYELERGTSTNTTPSSEAELALFLAPRPNNMRKKALTILARAQGFSANATAEHLGISKKTVRKYLISFDVEGIEVLLARKNRPHKADDDLFKKTLFGLLHEPPSLSGFNRTSWRMEDLQKTLAGKGFTACKDVIREAIKTAGYRWRSAKVVLTSTDPEYRQKLERVQQVLSNLQSDEKFFSIDEFGPFSVRVKGGRVLAEPGTYPSVPQWQKSKGSLIVTAALELSGNQVTHFYSKAKNTSEIIRMAEVLLKEHCLEKRLYLSWDAASWHMSKELLAFVDDYNGRADGLPKLELVPLPASAQFLNVIESVFSGMARAIIHNSDYPSVEAAREAIDRYFYERNQHFWENPKRAGNKIWRMERTTALFNSGNNCKDPAYR
jgi:transposase